MPENTLVWALISGITHAVGTDKADLFSSLPAGIWSRSLASISLKLGSSNFLGVLNIQILLIDMDV